MRLFARNFFFVLMPLLVIAPSGSAAPAGGYKPDEVVITDSSELPKELEKAGIKEKNGQLIDKNLEFYNEAGEKVAFKTYLDRGKPVLLSLIYYSCPNLCNLHMNGVTDALRRIKLTAGKDFEIVAISFDKNETPELAAAKKQAYVDSYGRPESVKGWNFLTGDEQNLKKIADQVGFSFNWDEKSQEWAHSSAAIMVTPEGKISRYLHGVYFEPQDMRLALLETAKGKIGNIVDQVLLYCFRFDPKKNKYTLYAFNVMRAGATATVLLLALVLGPIWFRERRASTKKDIGKRPQV